MKKNIFLSMLFTFIGVTLLTFSLVFCLSSLDAPAMILVAPKDARVCAQDLLDAVAEGDFDTASSYLYGQPQLGVDRAPSEQIGQMLWDAYLASFTYEILGSCYASSAGISLDVAIHALDLSSIGANLSDRMDALMTSRLAEEGDISEIYDENGNFQEDLIQQFLLEAFQQALDEDAKIRTQEIALTLTYQDGHWWVVSDQAFLQAISGGVVS